MDLRTAAADLRAALAFYTRLPLAPAPGAPAAMFTFARAAWVVPVVGAAVGAAAAAAFLAARAFGFASPVAALLALAALVTATGALHEDGLADCADGFGGGATLLRKLEIMRDSRLGTYGTVALVLTLALRGAALVQIAQAGGLAVAAVLVSAGAVSRVAALWPLVRLSPARTDGAGASAGAPTRRGLAAASVLAGVASLPAATCGGFAAALAALLLAALAALASARLAAAQIGGQTGDVAGATQQAAELAVYLAFAAAVPASM